jgi:hypothetical protein
MADQAAPAAKPAQPAAAAGANLTAADGAAAAASNATATPAKPQPGTKGRRQRGAGQMAHNQYSYEGLDADDWQETPWVRPDVLRARDYYKALLFDGGECSGGR